MNTSRTQNLDILEELLNYWKRNSTAEIKMLNPTPEKYLELMHKNSDKISDLEEKIKNVTNDKDINALKDSYKNEIQKYRVQNEFYETEKTFFNETEKFCNAMDKYLNNPKSKLSKKTKMQLEKLLEPYRQLIALGKMKDKTLSDIEKTIYDNARWECFKQVVFNQEELIQLIDKNKKFFNDPAYSQLEINSAIILPVQRGMRYSLLLSEMLKNSSKEEVDLLSSFKTHTENMNLSNNNALSQKVTQPLQESFDQLKIQIITELDKLIQKSSDTALLRKTRENIHTLKFTKLEESYLELQKELNNIRVNTHKSGRLSKAIHKQNPIENSMDHINSHIKYSYIYGEINKTNSTKLDTDIKNDLHNKSWPEKQPAIQKSMMEQRTDTTKPKK